MQKDADGLWTATWHLAEPARGLRFERPADGFRQRVYRVETEGFRFERAEDDGDIEVLVTDGAPSSTIAVRFPEYDARLPREYEFFRRFSDGSSAIYTGHLIARPLAPAGGATASGRPHLQLRHPANDWVTDFEFVPPDGQAVVAGGKRHTGPVRWRDDSDRGTYVYIGAIEPTESADVISVLDPALPRWLSERTREYLPKLFTLLRTRLGVAPSDRPVVLFDYRRGSSSGYSRGGGVLGGLIQLGVEGQGWDRQSDDALRHLLHFLAHESTHLWNGGIVRNEDVDEGWMNEGGADALAERALLELGVIDRRQFAQYQSDALNDCALGLSTTPLRASTRSQPRLAYACGNTIALLTELSIGPGGTDLFDFWRVLIERAARSDGTYEAEDYIAVWRSLGAADADVAQLEMFLDYTVESNQLVAALAASGVRTNESRPPQLFRQRLARDVFARVMAADCGGRIGFDIVRAGFALDAGVQCNALTGGTIVTSIERFDVMRDGDRAYDAVQQKCEAGAPVTVSYALRPGSPEIQRTVPCTFTVVPRPPYVAIDPAVRRDRL